MKRARVRELIAQYEADPDPLNLLPELAAARALFQDYIERYDEMVDALIAWHDSFRSGQSNERKPVRILDIADAHRLVAEVTKIAKRIEDIRAQNAVSRADFYRVLSEMGRAVDLIASELLGEPAVREEFLQRVHEAWMGIRL